MDSLLYLGAGDDDDDDDDDQEEEEEEGTEAVQKAVSVDELKPAALNLSFEALQRAGYSATGSLTETETYKKLSEAEEHAREEKRQQHEREQAEALEQQRAQEEAQRMLLDTKKIDERLGYEKRFAKTGEDFRAKEKRKRSQGQQGSGSNYVEEEKRRIRHAGGNYDS